MAKLSAFRVDMNSIREGTWVRVDEARYGDLEILARGMTDEFIDAQNALQRRSAQRYGGDVLRIPNAEMRQINAELLDKYIILDVRNLQDDSDNPVPVDEFKQMLYDPQFGNLAKACWDATLRVTTTTASQLENAKGNSSRPSKTSSNGATSEHV